MLQMAHISAACNYLRVSVPVTTARGELIYNITVFAEHDGISVVECWELADPSITSHVPGWIGVQSLDLDEIDVIHFDAVPSRHSGSTGSAEEEQ